MNKYHKVQNEIRKYRHELGMTIETLANAVGVHRLTVIKWEAQVAQPKTKYWEKIASTLGKKENQIFYLL
jgi:DNA-binding XRE family transcriptional regulator